MQLPCEPDIIRLNNCKLKVHIHFKYLQIFIDDALFRNKQIDILFSKLSKVHGILSKLPRFAALKPVSWYITLFSICTCCTVVWPSLT